MKKPIKPLNLYTIKNKSKTPGRKRGAMENYYKTANPRSVTYMVQNLTNIHKMETDRARYPGQKLLKTLESKKLSRSSRNLSLKLKDPFKFSALTCSKERKMRAKTMVSRNYDVSRTIKP